MRIRIHLPFIFLNSSVVPTVRRFYIQLMNVLEERHVPYELYPAPGMAAVMPDAPDIIDITYHTRTIHQNVWNIKISYLPDYFYFDPSGYSGWADLANNPPGSLNGVCSDSEAEIFYNDIYVKYVEGNISKYVQPKRSSPVAHNYIFIPCQVIGDDVLKLGRFNMIEMLGIVAEQLRGTGLQVVIKRHPLCESMVLGNALKRLATLSHVTVSDNSIHDLISNSRGVVAINSGVGFEALLHLKHVFTVGKSDYELATHKIKSIEDFAKITENVGTPVDETKIKKFIYYYLRKYLVDINDREQFWTNIQPKIASEFPLES